MKIDVHAHEFPENYLREIHRMVERGEFPAVAETLTPWRIDDHLALMEREGVEMQVLSLAAARYVEDRPQARALARMVNEAFADAAGKHPGKFVAFACVPLAFVDDAIAELEHAVGALGMRGLILGTNVAGKPLNAPELRPFFETVNRMKLPVLIHPMYPDWPESYSDYRLDLWLGWPYETTHAVSRMILSGMFDDFPDFPLIVSHLGANLHYMCERIGNASHLGSAKAGVMEYLRRFYYDTAGPVPAAAVGCALQMFSSEKILFGSDYPFGPGHGEAFIRKGIACIEDQACGDEEKEAMFSGNARGILGL